MIEISKIRKGRMIIWPFLCFSSLALVLTLLGQGLSAGLPWGVDDGVKRLMARSWAASGGKTELLESPAPEILDGRFFPIPKPFATEANSGFRGIFPGLFPLLGGALYMVVGSWAFYLLPALSLSLLLFFAGRMLLRSGGTGSAIWAVSILFSSLVFYSMTFWEYGLALLCLLPLVQALASLNTNSRRWLASGLLLAAASYLRPETGLLYPLVLVVLAISPFPRRWKSAIFFSAGLVSGVLASIVIERIWNGRWMPPQVGVNLGLAFPGVQPVDRIKTILAFLFNSPLPWEVYATIIAILVLLGLVAKKPLIFILGVPALSIISLLWGWVREPAFSLSGYSQGLFFAWPWAVLSLAPSLWKEGKSRPLLLVGWGYMLLLYLLAPDQPGIHWGPRFLFPALLPLLWCSREALTGLVPRQIRIVMAITALAALLHGAAAVTAVTQRGSAGKEVLEDLQTAQFQTLILDRWYAGADLEPLWGKVKLSWAEGPGNLEEMLIELREGGLDSGLGWLKQDAAWSDKDLPLEVIRREALPGWGGWKGELLSLNLNGPDDLRWGQLYWHGGGRRAARGDLTGALDHLRKAVGYLPGNADLHYDLAVTLGQMGKLQEAIDELREALRLNPQHAQASALWRRLVSR